MTDTELVRQVLNGNQHACRFLVAKYQNLVNHIIRRIVLRDSYAEDISQDVFLKVFRQIKGYRGDSRLSTWIATVAYNTAITYVKKKKVRNEAGFDLTGLSNLPQDGSLEPVISFESEEIKMILLKTIETIPVHYRSLLTLFYLEEFSYLEIEKITGMPEGTVKSYLYRARHLLKCKLEKIQENERTAVFAK
jgi:RNA polymerase sigma factor (sigma-70 family)